MDEPWRNILHRFAPLYTFLVQSRIRGQVPDTGTRYIYIPLQAQKYTRTHDKLAADGVEPIPVFGVSSRVEETGVVAIRSFKGHIALIQGIDRFLGRTRPVGHIMVHERRVVDIHLLHIARRLRHFALTNRSKLDIIIHITAVAPEYGVENHTTVTDIDTARTSVTTAIIGYIQTTAVIRRDRSMVDGAAFNKVYTAAFGVSGVIIDYAGAGEGEIMAHLRRIPRQDTRCQALRYRIFIRDVRNHQTTAATGCAVRDMAVVARSVIVDTNTAAVALKHTNTRSLASLDKAEIDISTAIAVDTSASHRSDAALHRTAAHAGITHHIYTAAIRRMLTHRCTLGRSATARYHASVQRCRVAQRTIVALRTVVAGFEHAVRRKPNDVERAGREGCVIASADGIEHKGRSRLCVVTREDRFVAEFPLRNDFRTGSSTDTGLVRPVLAAFLAVRHDTVFRLRL